MSVMIQIRNVPEGLHRQLKARAALAEGAGRVLICGSLYLAGEVLSAAPETWPT